MEYEDIAARLLQELHEVRSRNLDMEHQLAECRAMLQEVAKGIENVHHPDPHAKAREWCSDFSTYLRGYSACLLMLPPDLMRKLEAMDP